MEPPVTGPERLGDRGEELANVITHGAGVLLGASGTAVLVLHAARHGTAYDIVGVAVFGLTLILLYAASTTFHAARDPVTRDRLRVLDHCAIYLLIAGTYTPIMLGALRGGWGWSLFGVTWALALAGIAFKLRYTGRFSLVSTTIYIAMGWLALIAIGPIVRAMSTAALLWLVAGGVAYTAGAPFYQWARFRYAHAVWHLFVLAGSVCHGVAIAMQIGGRR